MQKHDSFTNVDGSEGRHEMRASLPQHTSRKKEKPGKETSLGQFQHSSRCNEEGNGGKEVRHGQLIQRSSNNKAESVGNAASESSRKRRDMGGNEEYV
jgi:hypothetical protein